MSCVNVINSHNSHLEMTYAKPESCKVAGLDSQSIINNITSWAYEEQERKDNAYHLRFLATDTFRETTIKRLGSFSDNVTLLRVTTSILRDYNGEEEVPPAQCTGILRLANLSSPSKSSTKNKKKAYSIRVDSPEQKAIDAIDKEAIATEQEAIDAIEKQGKERNTITFDVTVYIIEKLPDFIFDQRQKFVETIKHDLEATLRCDVVINFTIH